MALLTFSRKMCISGMLTHTVKPNRLWFHTLKKTDRGVITKSIPNELKTPKRNFFWVFKKRTKRELLSVDKPPANYELIYRCAFDQNILTLQHFGFYGAVTVFLIVIYQTVRSEKVNSIKEGDLQEEITATEGMEDPQNIKMMFIGIFFLALCSLHFFMGKLPVRIYYYPQGQKYKFCFYGPIPNQLKKVNVNVGEIKHDPDKAFLWKEETFVHKKTGQQLILFDAFFRTPADLYIMLGLQKDPDINHNHEEKN